MAGVGAHEVALDRAAVAMVPGFVRAAMGDHRPELGLELRRHRFGAVAGDVLAVAGPKLPAAFAVLPPLGQQAHRTAPGELEERDLGLPVGFVAGGDVVGAGGSQWWQRGLRRSVQLFGASHHEVRSRRHGLARNSFFGGGRCSQNAS